MRVLDAGLILLGVLLNAVAQLCLKAGAKSLSVWPHDVPGWLRAGWQVLWSWPIVAGLTCYAVSVVVWVVALSKVDVSVAYPMLSIGYVVNALLAYALFAEAIGPQRVLGMVVIMLGVVLVARS